VDDSSEVPFPKTLLSDVPPALEFTAVGREAIRGYASALA
jgi:hypothetical protein